MASKLYPKGIEQAFLGNLDIANDTIRALLLTDGYTYDESDNFVSDLVASEVAGGTRVTLASKTVTIDLPNDQVEIDAADPTFNSVTTGQDVGAIVYYKFVTNDSDSFLIAFGDGTDLAANGSNITVTLDAEGFAKVGY